MTARSRHVAAKVFALFLPCALHAASDVTISTAPTSGGAFSGGSPNVFTPSAAIAVATAGTIAASLNLGTAVTINTASGAAGNGDLTIASAVSKTAGASSALTLNAARNLAINAALSASTGAMPLVFTAGGAITSSASIASNGGNVTINTSGPFTLGNFLNAGAGQVLMQSGTLQSSASQTVTASTVQVATGATWNHRGTVTGALNVSGILSPGTAAASLNINGSGTLTLQASATTFVDLAGTVAGTSYDRITATGAVTIAGTLQLNFLNGFAHAIVSTNSFTILSGSSVTGTFAGLPNDSRITLPEELGSVKITYTATTVTLSDWQPFIRDLTWDLGEADAGTTALANTSTRAGRHYFRVNTMTTDIGAWKTRLTLVPTTGEADLYLRNGSIPQTTATFTHKSERIGDDGLILRSDQYTAGQTWYFMVNASEGARWSIFTGRAWVQNLGALDYTDTNGNLQYDIGEPALPSGTDRIPLVDPEDNKPIGPEGIRFFKTVVPTGTPAWSLWLNNDPRDIAVRKNFVPFHAALNPSPYDRKQAGQMLVVPTYLQGVASTYFLSVVGNPGDVVNLDSRIQEVTVLPDFDATTLSTEVNAAPYRVYRVTVPVNKIAWEVSTTVASGNPNVCLRRDNVPAEFDNDAFSEVPGAVTDSITLVPDFLTDGTWFITVYGTAAYEFTLRSREPTITPLSFTDTKINDEPNRAGWRYYQCIDSLGLGWELNLANQVPGTEIAVRLGERGVPSRWNYRLNGSPTVLSANRVDQSGTSGFLQRPGHQADVWYVGIYMPSQALGMFTLNSGQIAHPALAYDGGLRNVSNHPSGRWEYVQVDVPVGVLGWDVRLTGISGPYPAMVVGRAELASTTTTSGWGSPGPSGTPNWPSGNQWEARSGSMADWTSYAIGAPTNQPAYPRLVMGMDRPLQPGTYYVGVYNSHATQTTTYTIDSRGIGAGRMYQIRDLTFAGGNLPIHDPLSLTPEFQQPLAPREARYFKVHIDPNTPSWEVTLTPSVGEMLLAVRRGTVPDFNAADGGSVITESGGLPSGNVEVRMKKTGPERYVMLPISGQDFIPADDYYLAVVGEGVNPGNPTGTIGTGSSDGILTSAGPLTVTPLGNALPAPGLRVENVSLAPGEMKAFSVNVPPGSLSFEVQLEAAGGVGMKINAGTRVPIPPYTYGADGGSGGSLVAPIFTQANPTAGLWTVVLQASKDNPAPTTANMVFTVLNFIEVNYDGGTASVLNQPPQSWRYFEVEVPSGALGWDVRLRNVTGTVPRMVVRRDLLPATVNTTLLSPHSANTTWTSGLQWEALSGPGADGTDWQYDPGNVEASPRRVMGMGRPLQPGTYYVGVYNDHPTTATSYTIDSRGIGIGPNPQTGQPYTCQVDDASLTPNGNPATMGNLAPREAKYFKVTIPANTPSWEVVLSTTGGEMLLAVRRTTLPDFNADEGGNAGAASGDLEIQMKKTGPERYVMLPQSGLDFIPTGDYYLAVVGEGVNPGTPANTIGTGNSEGSLTSLGPLPVPALGDALPAPGGFRVENLSLAPGQIKAFTVNVPAGSVSFEAQLEAGSGVRMKVNAGTRLPLPVYAYGADGGTGGSLVDPIFTQANPTAGTWSVVLQASPDSAASTTANMVFTVLTFTDVAYDGGTSSVINQVAESWRYFRIDVPSGVLGWDVRLTNVSGALPQMVVRRDLLPSTTTNLGFSPTTPSTFTSWSSGNQWAARSGPDADWTGWTYDIGAPTNRQARPRLVMGMGRPLQAGRYFVGVYNSGSDPETAQFNQATGYTIDSRGIGEAGSGRTYQVELPSPLPFSGNGVPISDLSRREAKYFKVHIAANTPSWEVMLSPTLGEMMLAVRRGAIPDFNAGEGGNAGAGTGDLEIAMKKGGPERYLMLPQAGLDYLPVGDYYLAVVSEGVNPGSPASTIGTGSSDGVLTNVGPLTVPNLGTATPGGVSAGVNLDGGQIKAYQFDVPAGTESLEVRLDNRVGNPWMSVVAGSRLPTAPHEAYGHDGGTGGTDDDSILTFVSPTPGTWSALVRASRDADASATFVVRQKANVILNFAESLNGNGYSHMDMRQMIDGEYTIYQVAVPATESGQPVIGWIVETDVLQGAVALQVYKNFASPTSGASVAGGFAVIVPPFLTLGDAWYVRVKATGLTNYTLTSRPVTLERPVWTMPASHNPLPFGDSGNDSAGNPLPGDRGVDLAQGEWRFYAVDVPAGNAGLLRTQLQAISGNSNLYIREHAVPTTSHPATPPSGPVLYQRSLASAVVGSQYGNWVPLDGRTQRGLTAGRWYLGVEASGASNARYRLIASTGDVTDLALNGGNLADQSLAGNDWRYYRFTVPANAPNSWTLNFDEQVGDVVMWLRDSVPPGQNSTNSATGAIESWSSDDKNQGPYNASGHGSPGDHTFPTPPLRPGHTYYAGFRSNNTATFTVSSTTSGSIGAVPVLDYAAGVINTSVSAGSSSLYQISVPADGSRMKWTSTHPTTVQLRLEQGTLPGTAGAQHYASTSSNTTFNQVLSPTAWPFQPGQTYYLRVVNNSASVQSVLLTMNGKTVLTEDEDGDGLADAWELLYWPSITAIGSNGSGDPERDGVANLLEFAFNLHPLLGDVRTLTPGTGASGLPGVTLAGTGAARHLRVEYVRRISAALTYTVQFGNTPDAASWQSATAIPVVTPIDAVWERVTVDDTQSIGAGKRFARVLVAKP